MQGNYRLMRDDTHIGTFTINSADGVYTYIAVAHKDEQPLLFKLELQGTVSKTLSGEVVQTWLFTRAPESNYVFIDALMDKAGITQYDPLAFVEYNSGRFNTDKYYLEVYNR